MDLRSGAKTGTVTLPEQLREQFEDAIQFVFNKWTAVQLAVEHQWGGITSKDKMQSFKDEIADWLYSKKNPNETQLSDYLYQVMQEDFSVQLEDDSEHEVGRILVNLYNSMRAGDMTQYQAVQNSASSNAAQQSKAQVNNDDDENMTSSSDDGDEDCVDRDMDMDMDGDGDGGAGYMVGQQQIDIDEDGFQLVQHKRKGKGG